MIIDGKGTAELLREGHIKAKVEQYKETFGVAPKLHVIMVGDDPASAVYVRNKERACANVGIETETTKFSADCAERDILNLISKLNEDKNVDGILVQLPLPAKFDEDTVINAISPDKDVDGLTYMNAGMLMHDSFEGHEPCTPSGVMVLLRKTLGKLEGKHAVVVGRSKLVGLPLSMMLLQEDCTVTVCHSHTVNLKDITSQADILIVAVGKPRMITADMVKPGCTVIDVGINRTADGLVGDVDFDTVKNVAENITPVPGGVGPMTVAMLLFNTVNAAWKKRYYQ